MEREQKQSSAFDIIESIEVYMFVNWLQFKGLWFIIYFGYTLFHNVVCFKDVKNFNALLINYDGHTSGGHDTLIQKHRRVGVPHE